MDVNERQAFLSELDDAIITGEKTLDKILRTLDWDHKILEEEGNLVRCPVDSGHLMPPEALSKHMQYCPLVTKGYTKEELDQEHSSKFYYENAKTVVTVKIDEETHKKILSSVPFGERSETSEMPATVLRAHQVLTQAERMAVYDYSVNQAQQSANHLQVNEEELMLLTDSRKQDSKERPLSYIERLAESRDLKRRRQSYRAKNVHTMSKSHTEIIGELITNQMEALVQMRKDAERDSRHANQEASNERPRDTDQSRDKDRNRNGYHRDRDRSRELSGSYSYRHSARDRKYGGGSRERDRSRERDGSRERGRSRERDRSKEPDRSNDRDRSRDRDQYHDSPSSKTGQDDSQLHHRHHKKHKKHKKHYKSVKIKEEKDSD